MTALRLLHLSDIHFRPRDAYGSVDVAVRDSLLGDLERLVTRDGPVEGVLVVGDLAATGNALEYEAAAAFLARVCEVAGCAQTDIVCVPGNHDINRQAHSPLHDGLRSLVRGAAPDSVSDTVAQILRDKEAAEVLYRPLAAYNDFAQRFGCAFTSVDPVPPSSDFRGAGGLVVRVQGYNSAIICDQRDSDTDAARKLAVGAVQAAGLDVYDGTVRIALCHHPQSWLRDGEAVWRWLRLAHVVLTGHEHVPSLPAGEPSSWIEIASGAVNPDDRSQGWVPAYNILGIKVHGGDVLVDVWARSYGGHRNAFGPATDVSQPAQYRVPLDPEPRAIPSEMPVAPLGEEPPVGPDERDLIYRIFTAATDRRQRAARALRVLEADRRLTDSTEERELLRRARDAGKLAALAEWIDNV